MISSGRVCDKCPSNARYLVKELDLVFCGHHWAEQPEALRTRPDVASLDSNGMGGQTALVHQPADNEDMADLPYLPDIPVHTVSEGEVMALMHDFDAKCIAVAQVATMSPEMFIKSGRPDIVPMSDNS
jgi:hypothetical protein